MITNEIKVRNHYFYFHDYSGNNDTTKFFRYSAITDEVEELPYINEYMLPINFIDDYFLFQKSDSWLYRADKNFDNTNKFIDICYIEELNILDNCIYVSVVVEDEDGFLKKVINQYDTDGNLIKVFD